MNTEENVDDTHWVVNMGYLVGTNTRESEQREREATNKVKEKYLFF